MVAMWRAHIGAMSKSARKGRYWGSSYWRRWYDDVVLEVDDDDEITESAEASSHRTDEGGIPETQVGGDEEREETVMMAADSQGASAGGGCCEFASHQDGHLEDQNAQVARLIVALGENDGGKMAILRAIAERQGVTEESALQKLVSGRAHPDERLKVPSHLRGALCEIGLHEALVPINIITVADDDVPLLVAEEAWSDIDFEVALDSGAVIHVCSPADTPGYDLEESIGSKHKQKFLMGDGGEIFNLGQKSLNLCDGEGNNVKSVFQIAGVTRPLMSVGRICDEGHEVTFNAVTAVVKNPKGKEICRFERQPGGLYVAKMKLKSPMGFARPE